MLSIIGAQALMSRCSYTTLKLCLAQKRARSNSHLAPNCKVRAAAVCRLSACWCLAPARCQPLWSSDVAGSGTSGVLRGTACGGCGGRGEARRRHFIPKLQTRSTWPVDDTTRARELSCSAKSSPVLERQSTMELTFQSSDHR